MCNDLDREFFSRFRIDAKKKGLSLQDYYLEVQKTHRDEEGGRTELQKWEFRGIKFALKYIRTDETCLIMGCGEGAEISFFLNNEIKGITGCDISDNLLKKCRDKFGIKTICADFRNTPNTQIRKNYHRF